MAAERVIVYNVLLLQDFFSPNMPHMASVHTLPDLGSNIFINNLKPCPSGSTEQILNVV